MQPKEFEVVAQPKAVLIGLPNRESPMLKGLRSQFASGKMRHEERHEPRESPEGVVDQRSSPHPSGNEVKLKVGSQANAHVRRAVEHDGRHHELSSTMDAMPKMPNQKQSVQETDPGK